MQPQKAQYPCKAGTLAFFLLAAVFSVVVQIRGLHADEAIRQMKVHTRQKYADIVRKTIQNAVNLADIRYEVPPSELRVALAIVGRGTYMKRINYHSRGRYLLCS